MSDPKPIISVVMPCYYRFWHFIRAVEYNPLFQDRRVEIVLSLDEPSQSHLFLEWAKFNADRIKTRILVYNQSHDWRCPCIPINVGICRALGQYCIVQSPETIVLYPHKDFLFEVLKCESAKNKKFYIEGIKINVSTEQFRSARLSASLYERTFESDIFHERYGYVLFLREDAISIGGYDETRQTYGYDDTHFRDRLTAFGCAELFNPAIRVIHITHESSRTHFDNWQSPSFSSAILENAPHMGLVPYENIYDWTGTQET